MQLPSRLHIALFLFLVLALTSCANSVRWSSGPAGAVTATITAADPSSSGDQSNGSNDSNGQSAASNESDDQEQEHQNSSNPPSDPPSGSELHDCSLALGVIPQQFHFVSGSHQFTINSGEAVIIKLSGNNPSAHFILQGKNGAKLGAVCIVLVGNHPSFQADINTGIKGLAIFERGNLPNGILAFSGASVDGPFLADLGGNHAYLKVSGAKQCPVEKLSGNSPRIDCSN